MPHIRCDILIQAGHENYQPGDNEGGSGPLGDEKEWTPIIADTAVSLLNAHGVDARKEDARLRHSDKIYDCALATFVHFDDPDSGESGPSVGYPHDSDRPAVDEWKDLYRQFWPFPNTWHTDNYTTDEHHYYGFNHSVTSDAEFLFEFGDLGSLRQAQWLKPRLHWLGELLAHFLSRRSGLGNVPMPQPYGDGAPHPTPGALVLRSKLLSGDSTAEAVAEGHLILGPRADRTLGTGVIQDALNLLAPGTPGLAINLGDGSRYRGFYGPKTAAAVAVFQKLKGFPQTGEVDTATIRALDAELLAALVAPVPAAAPAVGVASLKPKPAAKTTGTSAPFHTDPSKSSDSNGSSKTTGLNGFSTQFSDGTVVIDATETLTAVRGSTSFGPVQARQVRVWKGDIATVEQTGYCHDGRKLPVCVLMKNVSGFPATLPTGYKVVDSDTKKSTQFGKFDKLDLGTGSEAFGITQTNSEVFGVSLKRSRLQKIFGKNYDQNPRRLTALVEVYLAESNRLVRVPLVDVGPGEGQPAHIDLTWAVDQFMKTEGEKVVDFRVLTT